mmetsp:Transcript_36269/g.88596  ORF Transcript_36269/g.88596 Transcript_36269/m.88596 type:complete len:130 (-) Transcript_36269:107-496(-)
MAFVGSLGALGSGGALRSKARCSRSRVRMSAESVVEYYFPEGKRNMAPEISFSGDQVSVGSIEVVPKPEPLLSYPSDVFIPDEVPDMGVAWPSGDGRQEDMTGTKGSFDQGNLKEYGPFPDFLKRSCDV